MHNTLKNTLLAAVSTLTLAACAVGPDFFTPAAPDVKSYTDTELPMQTATAPGVDNPVQNFVSGKDVAADWWKGYGSEPLNQLVDQAIRHNPDLQAASASLRQAQENYYAARGGLLPSVDAAFSPTREKFNPSAFGQTGAPSSIFTLYNASVNVSYTLDLFGGTRRGIEAAKAQADTQRYQLTAAYLSLTGNVVTAAIQEASLRQQIAETQNIIDIESKQLDVLTKQFEFGATPKSTVLAQQTELAQMQTTLPPLQKLLTQTHNQLAVLAGRFPGDGTTPGFDLSTLTLPKDLPLSLPSKLVEQRPDIKAAEEQLHAANAEIGVATANMLPQISLTGTIGSETTSFSKLFTSGAEVWGIGGNVLQPLFHGGELFHDRKAAIAAHDKAAAQYQSVVLQAFKNVADTLRALQYDAEGLGAQMNAERAAHTSLDLAQTQFQVGAISYPQLLDAQRAFSQARIGLVQANAARFADTAALYQSLGGGWWNTDIKEAMKPEPAKPADPTQPAPVATPAAVPAPEGVAAPVPTPAVTTTPAAPAKPEETQTPSKNEKKS